MVGWTKSEHTGLSYREHESKTTGVGRGKRPLRYYMMTYKLDGKTVSESLGWEGEYIKNEDHARRINQKLRDNRKGRTPPFTLAEYRQQNEKVLKEEQEQIQQETAKNLPFTAIFHRYLEFSKEKKREPSVLEARGSTRQIAYFPCDRAPSLDGCRSGPAHVCFQHVVGTVFPFLQNSCILLSARPAMEVLRDGSSFHRYPKRLQTPLYQF